MQDQYPDKNDVPTLYFFESSALRGVERSKSVCASQVVPALPLSPAIPWPAHDDIGSNQVTELLHQIQLQYCYASRTAHKSTTFRVFLFTLEESF